MTTIVLNLDDPAATVQMLRLDADGRRRNDNDLALLADAIAIEAAKDRKVIVLDVEELGLEGGDADWLRKRYSQKAARIIDAVAEQLDSLTPPRLPEPTGHGAMVRLADGRMPIRFNDGRDLDLPWLVPPAEQGDGHASWRNWVELPDPIEVLSEGVPEGVPVPGEITTPEQEAHRVDVSTPWWETCRNFGGNGCGHLDHTHVEGIRYGRKAAGA
jgi:hypothetical protein